MRAGRMDPTVLSPQMAALLTPETLAKQKPSLDKLGDPTKLTLESHSSSANGTMWKYLADFPSAHFMSPPSLVKMVRYQATRCSLDDENRAQTLTDPVRS